MIDRELLPLIVAAVGHRDLRPGDVPMLETRVEEVLRGLQAEAPSTPIVLLSALAEGADRLAARVALRLEMKLIVPLPKSHDAYAAEFSSDESRAEFAGLLARAEHVLPLLTAGSDVPLTDDDQYEHLVAFLLQHAQALIALWDGVGSDLAGGTANAVRFKLEGLPSRLDENRSPLDPPDTGPVYHVLTPRASNDTVSGVPGAVRFLLPSAPPGAAETNTHARVVRHMDAFNRDIATRLGTVATDHRFHVAPIAPPEHGADLSPALQHESRAFEEADTLAQFFQRKTNSTLAWFMVLAFFALFSFEIYAYYYYFVPSILLLYVIPVAVAYSVYLVATKRDYQNKYLDYRALAEGLRVQWFWHVAGLPSSVADHYLRKQRTELDWIRHAIRIWHLRAPTEDDARNSPGDQMSLVSEHWVRNQADYYAHAVRRDDGRAKSLRAWSNRLFITGMTLAAVHVSWQWFEGGDPIYPVLMAMSLVLILAALLVVYSDKRGYAGQAKQYARMAALYAAADARLRSALEQGDQGGAAALLLELGKETLAENGDWVLMHRERPLEVPKLG